MNTLLERLTQMTSDYNEQDEILRSDAGRNLHPDVRRSLRRSRRFAAHEAQRLVSCARSRALDVADISEAVRSGAAAGRQRGLDAIAELVGADERATASVL